MSIKYSLVRDVTPPHRGTEKSAIDLFTPFFDIDFVNKVVELNGESFRDNIIWGPFESRILLKPLQRVLIPAGVHFAVPENRALLVCNKSSVSSQRGITKLAELIDEDYQGEVFISIVNTSNKPTFVTEGQKIIQLLLVHTDYATLEEEEKDKLYKEQSARGTGCLGSTGV